MLQVDAVAEVPAHVEAHRLHAGLRRDSLAERLVMAEVELPSVECPLSIPSWLEGWIVREVSEDPRYRNSELARRIAAGDALPPLA